MVSFSKSSHDDLSELRRAYFSLQDASSLHREKLRECLEAGELSAAQELDQSLTTSLQSFRELEREHFVTLPGNTYLFRRDYEAISELIERNSLPQNDVLEGLPIRDGRVWKLNLTYHQLQDLSPISKLSELTTLYLYGSSISDLTPLAACRSLRALNLASTRVADLNPLQSCTALEDLQLQETEVTDLTPLSRCRSLKRLHLSETAVSDLTPLGACSELEILDLTHTPVSDVTALAGCQELKDLYLIGTQVSDISGLRSCSHLDKLHLFGSQVPHDDPTVRSLKVFGVRVII